MSNNINIDAMLVTTNWSLPGNSVNAEGLTMELCQSKGDKSGTTKVKTGKFTDEQMKPVVQLRSAQYSKHLMLTLPYAQRGVKILPYANLERYRNEIEIQGVNDMNTLADIWSQKVPGFVEDLASNPELTKGQLFNPRDYGILQWPMGDQDREALVVRYRNMFRLIVRYSPFPNSAHFSTLVGSAVEELRQRMDAENKLIRDQAMTELWDRMLQPVVHMAETLADPDKRVFESVLNNIEKIVEVGPALNIENSFQVNQMLGHLKQLIKETDLESIKKDPIMRQAAHDKAAQIAKSFGAMGSRKFS